MERSTSWGAEAVPADAATEIVAVARCWASEPSAGPASRTRSRSRRDSAGAGAAAGSWSQMVARQSRSRGRRRSARMNSRSAPRSSASENTISGGPSPRASRRAEVSAPGMDDRVVAGEVALDQVARGARSSPRGRRAGRTGARPPCAPSGSRRSARWWSGTSRRSARASAAAPPTPRWARTARARAGSRARLARAAPRACVETSSGSDTEPPLPERQRLPHGEHRRASRVRPERIRIRAHRLDGRAPVADQLTRVRRRDHHNAVAAPAQLIRQALDEAVDLVMLLPGPRGYLGNRERHNHDRRICRGRARMGAAAPASF